MQAIAIMNVCSNIYRMTTCVSLTCS